MALSTTQSVWRSGGGDQTRTAYCGSMLMAAQFYIASVAATSRNVQVSSSNTGPVILPANAVITDIIIAATTSTGGTNPTIDIGYTINGAATADGLANELPSDAKATLSVGGATAGTALGSVISSSYLAYITARVGASAASSGTITGIIKYYVADDGQQNV